MVGWCFCALFFFSEGGRWKENKSDGQAGGGLDAEKIRVS